MAESSKNPQKRKRQSEATATKPASTKGKKSKETESTRRASNNHRSSPISTPASHESGMNRSASPASSDFEEPDFILAEIEHEPRANVASASSGETVIPKDLIHRLLHHHFQDKDKMNINTDAKEVVCKYVEVFVREALARSAFMRQEADGEGGGDGFLEVEDLEKCAPLLVLDF